MDNPGFSYTDPTYFDQFIKWIVGYIDNNSLIITFREGESLQEALLKTPRALTSWIKLLQLTGEDLAMKKCVYSYMSWEL